MKRLVRYRLLVPMQRSRHTPEYTARGIAVGVFWALTPTFGVQMALVLLHWVVSRRLFRIDFNLIHAMAWTWLTNIATVIPAYYAFYVTGQLILGRWDDISGWKSFVTLWSSSWGEAEAYQAFDVWYSIVVEGWGLALMVGWLPWAALGTWLSYSWGLAAVVRLREARLTRRLRRRPHVRPEASPDAASTTASNSAAASAASADSRRDSH